MSAEQFYQVVLLPQGEFAQFLHAPADKRAELLEKLFGTDRFGKVENWLAERRRSTARVVAEAEVAIRELAARVAQVAGASHAVADAPRSRATRTRTRCPIPPGPRASPRPPSPRPRPARPASAPSARSWTRLRTASAPPSAWPSASAAGPTRCAPATSSTRPLPASSS